MNNERVIKRLKQKKWYVECQTNQEVDLVLHACDDAEIKEESGEKATKIKRYYKYPILIGYPEFSKGIEMSLKERCEALNMENITDWFFNAIKNNDSNLIPKLTPQNAEQEHWVQIILARLHGIPIEAYSILDNKWIDAGDDCSILMGYEYRIKPISTPLPIPREMWQFLNKDIRFGAMDKFGLVFFYKRRPERSVIEWSVSNYPEDKSLAYPLYINTDGINWETSLTERPEGV